ncbi:MAG TPA: quinone oxidoreductase [Anaerolineae bacterium]
MQAIVVHETGGPEVMRLEERPLPAPGPGQVRVKIAAAGVNFVDIYERIGLYKVSLPNVPGGEGAGTVDAVGEGVAGFKPGDRVTFLSGQGTYAEYALVPARWLVILPAGVSFEMGAAVMIQGLTAFFLSHETYRLQPGDRCLVHAAAGGVGLLLCQMAKMAGAYVIGTTSTEEKAAAARAAGANEVILYTQQDFEAEVKRITGGEGVQVVYDSVGKDTFDKSLNCLVPRGMLVSFGQSSGAVPPFDILRLGGLKSAYLSRPSIFGYVQQPGEYLKYANTVFDWIALGRLKVRIDRTYPLAQAGDAHIALASRATSGKVLLQP